MKCLIIGYGSIGKRHARVLSEMGHEIALLSQAPNQNYPAFTDLNGAFASFNPDYTVIANATGKHAATLDALAGLGYQGITLVEKPLAASSSELCRIPSGPVFVGYTLRFHPVLQQISNYLRDETLWSLNAYCGQYLPDWRPDRDYRDSYSARPDDGGVIRDLSHELDYVQWLAGYWLKTVAIGGKTSTLEILSEDTVSLLAKCSRCPVVAIHLNYLDRTASRWIVANGSFGTLRADLIAGTISVNGKDQQFVLERDDMIRKQHISAMTDKNDASPCTLDDAMVTMEWIDALHRSLADHRWIERPHARL